MADARRSGFAFLSAVMVLASIAGGCGRREMVISFQYDRPVELELPANIKRIAVADLSGTTDRDKSWGRAVSDSLAALTDGAPVGGRRLEVIRLSGIQPITEGPKTPQTASAPLTSAPGGRQAEAEALIVGWANVMIRDEQVAMVSVTPLWPGAPMQTTTRRLAVGAVEFRLTEATGSKVLATVCVTEQFDSLEHVGLQSAATSKPAGPGASEVASVDDVLGYLAERSARHFLARFAPRRVAVSQALKDGNSPRVQSGNRAAVRGEYAKALKRYQDAVRADPLDDAALFNAGLMCEALGRFDEAARYADRAAVLRNDKDYIRLGRRARGELLE